MWHFSIADSATIIEGVLEYRAAEYSLNFARLPGLSPEQTSGQDDLTSIAVGTLQLEIAVQTRALLYAWGYFPNTAWVRRPLAPPEMKRGSVSLRPPLPTLSRGVALEYIAAKSWRIEYDEGSGWLYFGDGAAAERVILFASNTAISLRADKVVALWLRPLMV